MVLRYRATRDGRSDGAWEMEITEYYYALTGESGSELLAYHWHPRRRSPIVRPHLHLGPALVPTGPIALHDVLRLAITDFGVLPRRPDWDTLLQRTRRVFEEQWPAM